MDRTGASGEAPSRGGPLPLRWGQANPHFRQGPLPLRWGQANPHFRQGPLPLRWGQANPHFRQGPLPLRWGQANPHFRQAGTVQKMYRFRIATSQPVRIPKFLPGNTPAHARFQKLNLVEAC